MKHTIEERPVIRPIAPGYDELYREPLRAARGIAIAFWLVIAAWGVLFAGWWRISHHQAKQHPPTNTAARQSPPAPR